MPFNAHNGNDSKLLHLPYLPTYLHCDRKLQIGKCNDDDDDDDGDLLCIKLRKTTVRDKRNECFSSNSESRTMNERIMTNKNNNDDDDDDPMTSRRTLNTLSTYLKYIENVYNDFACILIKIYWRRLFYKSTNLIVLRTMSPTIRMLKAPKCTTATKCLLWQKGYSLNSVVVIFFKNYPAF